MCNPFYTLTLSSEANVREIFEKMKCTEYKI